MQRSVAAPVARAGPRSVAHALAGPCGCTRAGCPGAVLCVLLVRHAVCPADAQHGMARVLVKRPVEALSGLCDGIERTRVLRLGFQIIPFFPPLAERAAWRVCAYLVPQVATFVL